MQEMLNKLNKNYGIASTIAQASSAWEMSGFRLAQQVMKEASIQNLYGAKNMFDVGKLPVPKEALSIINSVAIQQGKILSQYNRVAEIMLNSTAVAKLHSLQWSFKSLGEEIAIVSAKRSDWGLLKEFKEINDNAIEITDKIIEKEYASKADIEELKFNYQTILQRLDNIDTGISPKFARAIIIIGFFLALISEIRHWIPESKDKPKLEIAPKTDIDNFTSSGFKKLGEYIHRDNHFCTINRKSKVVLKPKRKSLVINSLQIGYNVIIMQSLHQWLFISYSDPKDGLPQTGWVLKKYVN
jgi:hypothetical protein